jgi:hypothetical protein
MARCAKTGLDEAAGKVYVVQRGKLCLVAEMPHFDLVFLKDYLVAEGYNDPLVQNGSVIFEAKYFYSQDAVKWVDLQAVEAELVSRAAKVRTVSSLLSTCQLCLPERLLSLSCPFS